MKPYSHKTLLGITLLLTSFYARAEPSAPNLSVTTQGLQASLNWTPSNDASGYRLFYAPAPYHEGDNLKSIDLGQNTQFSVKLWQKAAFYVAVKAYDSSNQSSEFSNFDFVQIEDRGTHYDSFWKRTIQEISHKQFASDSFLYQQQPDINSCFSGSVNEAAKNRAQETLSQIRSLHGLSPVQYEAKGDIEVQNSALIQKANNSLSHTPAVSSKCYTQDGFNGSSSSNIGLTNNNIDPADDLINFIDDAFNISTIGSVGHRKHLLNPFLEFTSYGQVYGGSAVKVFDFFDRANTIEESIPDYVAFPYLRYPFVFLSDKNSNKKTPWNISIIEDKSSPWGNQHDYFTNATVTITRKVDNHALSVNNLFSDTFGAGIPNNLSWNVDNWQYDTWYTVSVDNINYQSGKVGSISYDVFIDYKNFFTTDFPLESEDTQKSSRLIEGTLFDSNDKDSFELALSGRIEFSGSSQFLNTAYFIEVYDANKQLLQASDNPFSLNLPNGLYTLVVTNCHNQSCYNERKEYNIQMRNV
jgi:uncharacterized protein YkwD